MKKPISSDATLFLVHESGAVHALRGPRLRKLIRALENEGGGPEVCALQDSGYSETQSGHCVSGLTFDLVYALSHGGVT